MKDIEELRTQDNILSDIDKCIDQVKRFVNYEPRLEDLINMLNTIRIEAEGLDNIWKDTMSNFERGYVMKKRGLNFSKVGAGKDKGLLIKGPGYYLWGLTENEINFLLKEEE